MGRLGYVLPEWRDFDASGPPLSRTGLGLWATGAGRYGGDGPGLAAVGRRGGSVPSLDDSGFGVPGRDLPGRGLFGGSAVNPDPRQGAMTMNDPLIRYHWVYRAFLVAAQDAPDAAWIDQVWHHYFDRHYALLDRLYFRPKGVEDPYRRLTQLGRHRFLPLVERIGTPEAFEQELTAMWVAILARLHYQGPTYDVFVIVGLDATNIYSLTLDGQPSTVLCLEAVDAHRAGLQRLVAHESHHWARQAILGEGSAAVGERLVSEGLAAAFSEELCPGLDPAAYCYVPESTVAWVVNHRDALQPWFSTLAGTQLMDPLFSRTYEGPALIPGMPRRTGYVYGYLACREALHRGESPPVSAVDLVATTWQNVLGTGESSN